MSITRWDPWGDMVSLRDAMDQLLAESVIRPSGDGGGTLPLDVSERGDDFVVTAPIPGVSPDDVEISVLGDTLRIHGERRQERQEGGEGQRWLLREQRYGSFDRMVRLPSSIKAADANAEFRDGILTITLPKSDEAKERRIPVQAGSGKGQAQDVPIEAKGQQAREPAKQGDKQSQR